MTQTADKRHGADRRRRPRGGRRDGDNPGLTPLVIVVDPDPERRALSLELLVRLRFVVAPVETLAEALALVPSLTPEVIVASHTEASKLVAALSPGDPVPIVTVGDDTKVTDTLIDSVRRAIRHVSSLG